VARLILARDLHRARLGDDGGHIAKRHDLTSRGLKRQVAERIEDAVEASVDFDHQGKAALALEDLTDRDPGGQRLRQLADFVER
jgi:hypothetical protein